MDAIINSFFGWRPEGGTRFMGILDEKETRKVSIEEVIAELDGIVGDREEVLDVPFKAIETI